MRRIVMIAIILSFAAYAPAQDTLLYLPPVEVRSEVQHYMPFSLIWEADSTQVQAYRGQDLGSLLETSPGLLVRSYSPGGLVTSSGRGGASKHTAVVWNGVNLQSPLNGTLDLSMIPVEFVESVRYSAGGLSSLVGNGSFGGALQLDSEPGTGTGWNFGIGTTLGSFGLVRPFAKVQFGSDNYQGQMRLLWSVANNDFPVEGGDRQESGYREDFLVSQEHQLSLNARNQLTFYGWWQTVDRELPPNRLAAARNEYQRDSILRLGVEWEYRTPRGLHQLRAFRLEEGTVYGSDLVIPSANQSNSWVGQYVGAQNLGTLGALRFGGQLRSDRITGDALANDTRNFWDVYTALHIEPKESSYEVDLGLRLPGLGGEVFIPASHLGGRYRFSGWEVFYGVSNNFTLPTANDLFWADGFAIGNPDLLPERSIDQEMGINWRKTKERKSRFEIGNRLFYRSISNFIQWVPNADLNLWMPENLKDVRSFGVELYAQYQYQWQNFRIGIRTNADFNATQEKIEESTWEQLPNQPNLRLTNRCWVEYKEGRMEYSDQLIGPRSGLGSQYRGRVQLSWDFRFSKVHVQSFFRVENVWNSYVELFQYWPVPGRHFRVGVMLDL